MPTALGEGGGAEVVWEAEHEFPTAADRRCPAHDPAHTGRRITVPLYDALYGEVIDVVSWPDDAPAAWSLERELATIAGLPCLRISYLWQLPCPIWRTPAAWHAHHEHGICVLDWEVGRLELWDIQLIAEDVHHGHEIRQRILGPPRPEPRIAIRRAVA